MPKVPTKVFYHWTNPKNVGRILKEGLKAQAGPDTKTVGNPSGVYMSVRDNNPMAASRQQSLWRKPPHLEWVDILNSNYDKTFPLQITIPESKWKQMKHSRPGHITGDSEVALSYEDIPAEYIKPYKLPENWRKRVHGAITPPGWKPGLSYDDPNFVTQSVLANVRDAVAVHSPYHLKLAAPDKGYSSTPAVAYNWDDLYSTPDFDSAIDAAAAKFKPEIIKYILNARKRFLPRHSTTELETDPWYQKHPHRIESVLKEDNERWHSNFKELMQPVPFYTHNEPAWHTIPDEVIKLNTGKIAELPYTPEDVARYRILDILEAPSVDDGGVVILNEYRTLPISDMPAYRGTPLLQPVNDLWQYSSDIDKINHDYGATLTDIYPELSSIDNQCWSDWLVEHQLPWLRKRLQTFKDKENLK